MLPEEAINAATLNGALPWKWRIRPEVSHRETGQPAVHPTHSSIAYFAMPLALNLVDRVMIRGAWE